MIYTVTFNPALDYVIAVDHFVPGQINRTKEETMVCGGKGINVSTLLANLGYESTALGFVAGFTGEEIVRRCQKAGFHSDFIRVKEGLSRINVKMKSDEETEINGMGPRITEKNVALLFDQLDELKAGDVLVLSGSIPSSIGNGIYKEIMERLSGRGIQIVVDAEKHLLMEVLPLHPFLIKPNNHELEAMLDRTLTTREELLEAAKELQARGARNVLVSMAGDGALLLTENGEIYKEGVCRGTVINSVGAGDSMVAGFIAGYLENGSYEKAFQMGVCTGSASAFSEELATKAEVIALLDSNKKLFIGEQ